MKNKKILLVEDESDLAYTIKIRLENSSYDVVTCGDGYDALKKAKEEKPDLIILDVMLPKIDGYKVCRMLKFDDKYKHIPIIIFTSRADDASRKIADEVKADSYITKPFEPETLLSAIKGFIGE
ncbi:MAG: response regulator [Candidatus Omnitrophota bacterium]